MARKTTPKPKAGALRVWWIPPVPGKRFYIETLDEAPLLLTTLARYDAFQLDNNIKPDYCNAGGLEVFEDGEWLEWNDEWGSDINDVMRQEAA